MENLKRIDQLRRSLTELRECGNLLKQNLGDINDVIDENKFAKSANLKIWTDNISAWLKKSVECAELYVDIFKEALPEKFSDVEKNLDAEEKRIREESVFGLSEKFLLFVTASADLKKILHEHQAALKKLLARKRKNDQLKAALEPYAKFFIATKETAVAKKFSAGKDLSDFFGDEFIGRGLFGSELTEATPEEILAEKPVRRRRRKIEPAEKLPEPPKKKDDFKKIIRGALLTEDDLSAWEKIFAIDKNDRNKEFSSVLFKRDFKKNAEILKPVLRYVSGAGILSWPAFRLKKMSKEVMESLAQILFNRGYIQKYSFGERGNFYGLTRKFFEFVKTDSGKKFVDARRNKIELENICFLAEKMKNALVRAIYCHLYAVEFDHGSELSAIEFLPAAFRAEFSGNGKRDLILGCFWEKVEECETFLRREKNYFKKTKNFDRVFVAGLSLNHAEKISVALEKIFAEDSPAADAKYLYDFGTDEFFIAGTEEKISAEKIWNDTPPEDDPAPEKIPEAEEEPEEISVPQKSSAPALDANVKEKILHDVKEMLLAKKFFCAAAYLKAQSLEVKEAETLYRQLAFALDDPLLKEGYSADSISILATTDDDDFNEALITAAAVRAIFYNDFGVDYGVQALHALTKSFALVKENAPLAELLGDLKNFKSKVMKGVDFYADYRTKDKLAAEENLAKVIVNAEGFYTKFFAGHLSDNADNKAFIRLKKILFARDGDLAQIFGAIKDKDEARSTDTLEIVKNFLAETFIKKDADFTAVNLDAAKLKQFIADNWDAVCDKKNPGKLTGELENNITKTLERAAEIMCAWVSCAEILCAGGQDFGSVEYKKIRSRLLEKIQAAQKTLADDAGSKVLEKTLAEISARLDGSFSKLDKKFFYVEFLRGDKIVLDEKYFPNFELNITDGSREKIPEQIKLHAEKNWPTFEERVEQIFEAGGDDFFSAKLIDDYLKEISGASFIEQKEYDVARCITGAGKDALRSRENFIGGLELAQSYGQFDTEPDGRKEKILQLTENCYAYATATKNFGVFFRVKKFWENVIEANAAERGEILKKDLRAAIDSFKKISGNFDGAELSDGVAEIEKIIASKNFTAAQGLIFKLSRGELYKKFDEEEDTPLAGFLDAEEYSDCYNRIKDSGYSLEILIGKKIFPRDKISRAKLSLVKNWITNPVGEDKIKILLELLGFGVESVQKISSPGTSTLNFSVKIFGDGRTKYSHPIAAFGSEAEVNGFNVACLFGKFDEKNLLEKFKELGNGKDTLVFLDYALDLPTRRRLAKEIKLDKNLTKIFALVDRVAIMYLLKNCAGQLGTKRITATLMSLVMPFARCQPYIWSPRTPLPPEMFIGREKEINEVMNHGGVNIVCGGRQLGKSALLKMACKKIDGQNERAIFIDIDDKNYRDAAILTSRELSDKNFFSEPIETDDWEELTRAIRNRLMSDSPTKISYFLLTLDEADKFIESCAENNYAPIVALAKTQQEDYNGSRFKFVIAGLRNIIRFEREKTFSNNNILPTLKSLTVKPFGVDDARKLLEVPLRYLGLYFPESQKDSLILTILETANYFPSLIQLYCEKLITALFEPGYAGYDANTPIYRISEEHIKKILADKDFTKDIKTKIEITLRLGEDKYYFVIANLLAHLYYKQNNSDGYSPQEILNAAEDFDLTKEPFLPDSAEKIGALMEELCELNILRKTGDAKYLFSRQRILRIVGTTTEVNAALEKLWEEATNG